MRVERIPTFRDNYTYLVIDPATDEAAVVDAPEADPVIERVESLDVKVAKVLSTHHHPDHSAANPVLAERYGAPVFGHVSDAKRIPGFTDGLEEGDTISAHRMSSWSCLPVPNTRWAPDGRFVCSPAFGGHPASIVPAAYSSVPKTGQNRRTSRPHLALRGTTWHKSAPYMYAYMRVRRTSGIATSCHPAQLPREDRARPPGRRATVAARGR